MNKWEELVDNVKKEVLKDIKTDTFIKTVIETVVKEKEVEMPDEHRIFKTEKSYFIRTVTYHLVGRVKKVCENFIVLENASWVADSGRFMNAIKEGSESLSEVEPVGEAYVNLDSITDAFPWLHDLPSEQK